MQLGGPAGAAVGAVVGAGATIANLPQKIMDWSQALVDSRDHLSKWSGQLQAMRREAEIRTAARDIQSARETAPYASSLNQVLQDIYDEMRPIKDEMYKITASLAIAGLKTGQGIWEIYGFLRKVDPVLSQMDFVRSKILEFIDWTMGKDEPEGTTVQKWAEAWRDTRIPSARVPRR